jgi:hypothetical protein
MSEPETLIEHYQHYEGHYEDDTSAGPEDYSQSPPEPTPQSVAEQLNSLLLSADGAARRIVEEAESRARDQLAEADARIRKMEAEAAKMAAWSQQTEQMLQTLSSAVGEFRKDVEAIPQRMNEALSPLASHVPVLVRQMEELMGALSAPPSDAQPAYHEQPVETVWSEGWDQSGNAT